MSMLWVLKDGDKILLVNIQRTQIIIECMSCVKYYICRNNGSNVHTTCIQIMYIQHVYITCVAMQLGSHTYFIFIILFANVLEIQNVYECSFDKL